jgi:hypothetical protein
MPIHVVQKKVYVVSLSLREQITHRKNPKVFLLSLRSPENRPITGKPKKGAMKAT